MRGKEESEADLQAKQEKKEERKDAKRLHPHVRGHRPRSPKVGGTLDRPIIELEIDAWFGIWTRIMAFPPSSREYAAVPFHISLTGYGIPALRRARKKKCKECEISKSRMPMQEDARVIVLQHPWRSSLP